MAIISQNFSGKILVTSDHHIGIAASTYRGTVRAYVESKIRECDYVIFNGDYIDSFRDLKDTDITPEYIKEYKREKAVLLEDNIREQIANSGTAKIIYLEGNHEGPEEYKDLLRNIAEEIPDRFVFLDELFVGNELITHGHRYMPSYSNEEITAKEIYEHSHESILINGPEAANLARVFIGHCHIPIEEFHSEVALGDDPKHNLTFYNTGGFIEGYTPQIFVLNYDKGKLKDIERTKFDITVERER